MTADAKPRIKTETIKRTETGKDIKKKENTAIRPRVPLARHLSQFPSLFKKAVVPHLVSLTLLDRDQSSESKKSKSEKKKKFTKDPEQGRHKKC